MSESQKESAADSNEVSQTEVSPGLNENGNSTKLLPTMRIDPSLPRLEKDFVNDQTIYLVDFDDFKAHGSIPKYPEYAQKSIDVNISTSLVVFISHTWIVLPKRANNRRNRRLKRKEKRSEVDLADFYFDGEEDLSSEEEDLRPQTPRGCDKENTHIDTFGHDKHQLCVEALQKIKDDFAPDMDHIYIWMDYCCVDQNIDKTNIYTSSVGDSLNVGSGQEQLLLLDRIVKLSDCILTVLYDKEYLHDPWKLERSGDGLHEDYKARAWRRYLNRRWCRIEMAYGATVPIVKESLPSWVDVFDRRLNPLLGKGPTKVDRMSGGLQYERLQARRPHLLYGTRESVLDTPPHVLPILTLDMIKEKYDPNEGLFSRHADEPVLKRLNIELWPYLRSGEAGYDGERDNLGEVGELGNKHGQGKMSYPNGNVYEGQWHRNTFCGQGVYHAFKGDKVEPDKYVGTFDKHLQHGEGEYLVTSNGSKYKGDWVYGEREGFGTYRWPDTSLYRGYWKADERHGFGKLELSNGHVYEGFWVRGKREGKGKMRWSDGSHYDGDWVADMRHGQGTYYNTFGRGSEYVGAWEYGDKHGFGVLTIGKYTLKEPQILRGMFQTDNFIAERGDPFDDEGKEEEEERNTETDLNLFGFDERMFDLDLPDDDENDNNEGTITSGTAGSTLSDMAESKRSTKSTAVPHEFLSDSKGHKMIRDGQGEIRGTSPPASDSKAISDEDNIYEATDSSSGSDDDINDHFAHRNRLAESESNSFARSMLDRQKRASDAKKKREEEMKYNSIRKINR